MKQLALAGVAAFLTITVCASSACSTAADPPTSSTPPAPRPASIAVERIEPCNMLSEQQANTLRVRRASGTIETVDGRPSPGCGWIVDASRPRRDRSSVDFNSQIIPAGIGVASGTPGLRPTTINGFTAIVIPPEPGDPNPFCQVAIDAAEGQTIRVQALLDPSAPRMSDDELCRRATDAASMVMTTVVATASR